MSVFFLCCRQIISMQAQPNSTGSHTWAQTMGAQQITIRKCRKSPRAAGAAAASTVRLNSVTVAMRENSEMPRSHRSAFWSLCFTAR